MHHSIPSDRNTASHSYFLALYKREIAGKKCKKDIILSSNRNPFSMPCKKEGEFPEATAKAERGTTPFTTPKRGPPGLYEKGH
jgi:hypothetical protein